MASSDGTPNPFNSWFNGTSWVPISNTDPLPIAGTFSANLGGWAPNGNVSAPLAVSAVSANVVLPAGTVIVVSNVGAVTAFVRLGTGSPIATASDVPVSAGSQIGLTVGTNTSLGAITSTGSTTINIAGGTGLFTATAASQSGGISNTVTLAAGAAAVGTVAVSGTVPVSGTVAVSGAISGTVTLAAGAANVGTVAVSNLPATQPVSGSVTIATGAATIGALALHQSVNLDQVGGAAIALGQTTLASSVPVAIASNQGAVPVSGTVAVSGTSAIGGVVTLAAGAAAIGTVVVSGTVPVSGSVTANLGTLNGAATAANQTAVQGSATGGAAGTSSELVGGVFNTSLPTLTNGQQGAIQLDASGRQIMGASAANIGTVAVSGTSAVSGTVAVSGTPTVTGTVGISAGAATIGALVANQSVNLNQIAGAAPGVGNGTAASALRVTLPTDGTGVVFATPNAGTTGGATPSTLVTAASNNQTTVKGIAGVLYGVQGVSIANAAAMWIKLFDATSITPGTTNATYQIGIPAAGTSQGAGAIWYVPIGIQHSTGIVAMITGGIALNDNTSVAANAAAVTFLYK